MASFTIKTKDFIPLISSLHGMIEMLEFEVSKNGVTVSQMDCSHVSLFHLHFPVDSFTSFKLHSETEVFYAGFHIHSFLQCIPSPFKHGSRNADFTIHIKDKDSPVMEFCLRQKNAKITTTFSLKNQVESKDVFTIPRHVYDSVVQMKRCTFASTIQTLTNASDTLRLTMTAQSLSFHTMTWNDPPQPVQIQFDPYDNNPSMILKEHRRNISAEYSTRYVHAIWNCIAPASFITLSQKEDKPLKISCVLKNNIVFEYFLAPKIE